MSRIFNFSAGPALLPQTVLQQAQNELCNWQGLGSSVMEVSHRGKAFMACAAEAEQDLRDLLAISDEYAVLFCQGGARGQFMALPQNLLGDRQTADYIESGYWSECAADEAAKVCTPNRLQVRECQSGLMTVKPMSEWILSDNAAYLHYCPNETIDGVAIFETPNFGEQKIVTADFSSCILSQPIDVSKFDLIYAGAQKNIGPAGITIVIVKRSLLGRARTTLPSVLDYQVLAKSDSMFNTPPTFAWYLSGLVFKWIKAQGGVAAMAEHNTRKAQLLYDAIDHSQFYSNQVAKPNRSLMNIPFKTEDPALDALFIQEASEAGLQALKGHRIAGGMRASLYNAMPYEGVQTLVDFMHSFQQRHGG